MPPMLNLSMSVFLTALAFGLFGFVLKELFEYAYHRIDGRLDVIFLWLSRAFAVVTIGSGVVMFVAGFSVMLCMAWGW